MTFRLGIDLGTSTTVAVLAGPVGPPRTLLFDASPLLSSAVFAGPGADLRTGQDAERAATARPEGLELNPKRRIDENTVWLGEREYPVVDILGAVLGRVAAEARRVAGETPQTVILTHPAAWGRARLNVLVQAAEQAGLAVAALVPEPVAAAAYFVTALQRNVAVGRCVVVYDLGAGTFDVSVVRRAQTGFEVVAADGLTDVGGLDLDAVVVAHARGLTGTATDLWGTLDWPQTAADRQARHALWSGARATKEQLTRHATADLYVPLVDTAVHLTRDEFEKAARPHLERTVALTVGVLRDAGIGPERVDGVFLVGGSSRTPLAATLLHRTMRISPTVVDQPELVVAEGSLHTPAAAVTTPQALHVPAANAAPVGPFPAGDPVAADDEWEPAMSGDGGSEPAASGWPARSKVVVEASTTPSPDAAGGETVSKPSGGHQVVAAPRKRPTPAATRVHDPFEDPDRAACWTQEGDCWRLWDGRLFAYRDPRWRRFFVDGKPFYAMQ
ncbi:Hsp70 family protein [Dactylosporangium sp. NPDC048998]|uniref:Hsp70 family protein n=1 Tax=Dactylosporangium sp. NPDC048998 TaxID=3363976 RepID=UPI0037156FDE